MPCRHIDSTIHRLRAIHSDAATTAGRAPSHIHWGWKKRTGNRSWLTTKISVFVLLLISAADDSCTVARPIDLRVNFQHKLGSFCSRHDDTDSDTPLLKKCPGRGLALTRILAIIAPLASSIGLCLPSLTYTVLNFEAGTSFTASSSNRQLYNGDTNLTGSIQVYDPVVARTSYSIRAVSFDSQCNVIHSFSDSPRPHINFNEIDVHSV